MFEVSIVKKNASLWNLKRTSTCIMESKKRPFHQFTSNFPNRNSFWQKLNMEPTFKIIPGYNYKGYWNMLM